MPIVLCLKAYFVKSDLAMYDEDQVAAAIQIINTERPLFTTLWILWHCLAFKYLKHLSQIILSVGSWHVSCQCQGSMPALCEVWLPIPKLLALLYLQQSCFCVKTRLWRKRLFHRHSFSNESYESYDYFSKFILQCCQDCPAAVRSTNLCPLDLVAVVPIVVFWTISCAHRVSFVLRMWGGCHKFGATNIFHEIPGFFCAPPKILLRWSMYGEIAFGIPVFSETHQWKVVSDSFKHKFMTCVFPSLSSIEMACRILWHVCF